MTIDTLPYAGFCPRLGSIVLDVLILTPLIAVVSWADTHYRLFRVYYLIPGIVLGLFYSVYLVRRYGGTPGKLIAGIHIRKLDGEPVGCRQAFLRYFPDAVLGLLMSVACIVPLFHMTVTEYQSLSFRERTRRMSELAPSWSKPLRIAQNVWLGSEVVVLLTNRKRRALHDFIAGTVVVHASSDPALQPGIRK